MGHDLHQEAERTGHCGHYGYYRSSIATVPAVAADKAPAPATATVQSKLITGYTTSTDQ
ncbi:lysophospholipase L2 [Cutibacterium acnes JCM 18916]|nr:lysophospholipase L2 [Cutibacterium acnes JCM 18916]